MFKLRCPIQSFFISNGHTCEVTQLYEERYKDFYGNDVHGAVDFATKRDYKYKRHYGNWTRIERTKQELNGRIPIVACHAGTLSLSLDPEKQRKGWGLSVILPPKGNVQYKTLYWHIETPWGSLKKFGGVVKSIIELIKLFAGREVRTGAIIAIGGDNGMSTGPHLHLGLYKRSLANGVWTGWQRLNPMEYFDDNDIVYQRLYGIGHADWFYKGKKVTREQVDEIFKDKPKVV